MRILLIILGLSFFFGCGNRKRKIQNIETFAKIYGYVRWFHPSDEAQEIDWDKFAVLGVKKVEGVQSDAELKDSLISLFSPIVQGLQIYETGKQIEVNLVDLIPANQSNNKLVSWQHYGVNLNEKSNIYKSIRTNKPEEESYSMINKWIFDLSNLKGKELKFSGFLRAEQNDPKGKAYLYLLPLQMNEVTKSLSSIISKNRVQINASDWTQYEISAKIGDNTSYIVLGCAFENDINVWADDFELSMKSNDGYEVIKLPNNGFESSESLNNLSEWHFDETKHQITVTGEQAYSGNNSVSVKYTGKMFEKMPDFGDVVNEPIGSNLSCVIPLTLVEENTSTFPETDIKVLNKLKAEISDISSSSNFDLHVNLASVIIAWNVFQHFYPYFDVIDTDWDKVLTSTITKAYEDTHRIDFTKTLSSMVAELDDGHGVVYGENMYHLPIRTEIIEDKVVITGSENSKLKVGDIILKLNGIESIKVHQEMKSMISGSPQLKEYRALNVFGSTFRPQLIKLLIERKGEQLEFDIQNGKGKKNIFFNPINDMDCDLETIKEIESGIYYANLKNCTKEKFTNQIDELAKAKSVIYDFRWGGRFQLTDIIQHLIDTTVMSAWMDVPEIIYPNQQEVTFQKSIWSLKPNSPHFKSKSIFLTAPCVVSSGETAMGIIDHYNLATTVGEPTAGCNGNVNWIILPCGYQIMWTGMRVLKHDGSQLYLIGFEPNYPVQRTMRGVMEWEDEVLEKAIEIARN